VNQLEVNHGSEPKEEFRGLEQAAENYFDHPN
jgi:hypothetical protein